MQIELRSKPYTAWELLKSYWQSRERGFAYGMLIAALFLTIVLVGIEVVFNNWYNLFYNALQDYDRRSTIDLLMVFMFIAALAIVIAVYRYYILRMRTQIHRSKTEICFTSLLFEVQ